MNSGQRMLAVAVAIAVIGVSEPASAQVRIAPVEATGVARRVTSEPTDTEPPQSSSRRTNRTVVSRAPGGFVVGGGLTSRGFLPTRYFRSTNRFIDGYATGYSPFIGVYRQPLFLSPYDRTFILPPSFVDAGEHFGPRAAIRFQLGEAPPAPAAPTTVIVNNAPAQPNIGPMLPPEPKPQPFAKQARGRAWKFIDYGDRRLRAGKPREAIQRYRKAADTDPALGEAHFRTGWAELVIGNLGRASVAFRRGLQADPAWPVSDFVLEELLNDPTRAALFRTLSGTLNQRPNDADALFVLAIAQHFDGQIAVAQRGFVRVQQLTGDPAAGLFLPQAAPEQVAEE